MFKVTIIGAGKVGATAAYTIAQRELASEIILLDIKKELLLGQAEDINHALAMHKKSRVIAGDYKDVSGSDAVVIACGMPRGAGIKDRMELLEKNIGIVKSVAENLKKYANGAAIVTVISPIDVMNYLMQKITGFPKEKIIGFGNMLDSARFKYILSGHIKCKPSEIENAFVIGEHGELMVPVFSGIKIRGKPYNFSDKEKREITEEVRKSAFKVLSLKGGTEFGPASCITDTVEAILKDKKELMPVSLAQSDFSIGVLTRVGKNGAEPAAEIKLDKEEQRAFEEAKKKVMNATNSIETA